jgi:hypothetical protein
MKLIRDSIIAIGDSFTDYKFSWADHLSTVIDKPLVKFSVSGASNKTILHNFYSQWYYEKLDFTDCIVIYQSTSISREDIDISPNTNGRIFADNHNIIEKYPTLVKEIYGKIYMLSGIKTHFSKWGQEYRSYASAYDDVDRVRDFSFQMNLLSEALKLKNNKFLFLLGLHNAHSVEQMDFSEFPLNCETLTYEKNGIAHGIDQYVIDINQIDETKHPSIEGHKSITNNLVLPKLRELKWTTK